MLTEQCWDMLYGRRPILFGYKFQFPYVLFLSPLGTNAQLAARTSRKPAHTGKINSSWGDVCSFRHPLTFSFLNLDYNLFIIEELTKSQFGISIQLVKSKSWSLAHREGKCLFQLLRDGHTVYCPAWYVKETTNIGFTRKHDGQLFLRSAKLRTTHHTSATSSKGTKATM